MPTIEAQAGGVVYVAPGSGIKDWSYGIDLVRKWPQAEQVYDRVLKATGVNIFSVCERAQTEPIEEPEIAQPAALGIGYASADYLRHNVGPPNYLMGLSAGEFTVAAISGALSLEDAAMLSHNRGRFQQEVAGGKGGSILVMHHRGPNNQRFSRRIEELIANIPGTHVANYHTPLKTGIGYLHSAEEELMARLDTEGIRRVMNVANLNFAPHGPAVERAQEMLSNLFERSVVVKNATVPIVANKSGRLMQKAGTVKHNLIWQTTSPTQLNRGMAYLISRGVEEYIDIGPDKAMAKLLGDFVALHNIKVLTADNL